MMRNPLIVALDVPSPSQALRLVEQLKGIVGAFKIGSELFTIAGPEIVRQIRGMSESVFLDLKFHDIENTVAKAVASAVQLDVQMLTVHTSGGSSMLKAAEQAAREGAQKLGQVPPLVLGVTVLTSFDDHNLAEIGVAAKTVDQVERLARLAVESGLRGLVCSPLEVAMLRRFVPAGMQLVTPGIRASTDAANDQKRTLSASQALAAGASWLVVGRPIYAAADPAAAATAILASIN